MSDTTIEQRLAELEDQLALQQLLARYAVAVDTRDWTAYAACFSDDADIDYLASGGPRGTPTAVAPWLDASLANFAMSSHYVTNIDITVDGDEAWGTALFYSPMGSPAADATMSMLYVGGRYTDRYTRAAGGWKIAARRQDTGWFSGGWTPPA